MLIPAELVLYILIVAAVVPILMIDAVVSNPDIAEVKCHILIASKVVPRIILIASVVVLYLDSTSTLQ